MEHARIAPYSPEWWSLRHGCFTGSEIWKLMTEPKGKSPKQKFEEHAVKLAESEARYNNIPDSKLNQKSSTNLKAKIEKYVKEYAILNEKKNDCHISDTAETYILEKVHEKLTGKAKMGVDNFATQWGVEHEPLAKKWYAKITGNVLEEPYMKFHDTIEGFSCTPDAFGSIVPLSEFKCPANGANHLKHWLISSDEYFKDFHPAYYWQCVAQMNIFSKDRIDFVSFDPRIDNDRGMFIYTMDINEEDAEKMEKKVLSARELYNDYYNLFNQKA